LFHHGTFNRRKQMSDKAVDTETLVECAKDGDAVAKQQLFERHRDQLRRMIAVRLDPRLAARLDPSDVVQDALAEAATRLDEYFEKRPMPFYPWLRRLAWEKLVELHRTHIRSQKRSVTREEDFRMQLNDESAVTLARRLASGGTSPSMRLVRQEMLDRVHKALERLSANDREVLVLRHLEQLSTEQVAVVLGISATAARTRHFRAVRRLHDMLHEDE